MLQYRHNITLLRRGREETAISDLNSTQTKPPENDLISKKELLATYGISYGALYRWKRMGLIPEEWFIKKSAFTGQETYFSRSQICERIEYILKYRDEKSLDQIAEELNGNPKKNMCRITIKTKHNSFTFNKSDFDSLVLETADDKITANNTEEIKNILILLENNTEA